MLDQKSLTELRTIAHGLGVSDIFSKAPNQLIQDIELKHKALSPAPKVLPPVEVIRVHDGEMCSKDVLLDVLQPYIKRGLKVDVDADRWKFSFGQKMDTGTLAMPLRTAVKKAQEVLL